MGRLEMFLQRLVKNFSSQTNGDGEGETITMLLNLLKGSLTFIRNDYNAFGHVLEKIKDDDKQKRRKKKENPKEKGKNKDLWIDGKGNSKE